MILNYKNSTINYRVEGKGEAVILLHGFLETIEMWKALTPVLSTTHQVISIDLLGHGKTDCLGYVHTMDNMADAVFAVLEHHNINRAHFIGHSMGGYVALALAEKKPELFIGICLMNSTFEADDDEKKTLRTRANEIVKINFEYLVRMSFERLFAPKSKIKFKQEFEDALQIALQTGVQSYIAASEGMKLRPNRFKVLTSLHAKKLIILGEKDDLIDGKHLIHQIKDTDINYDEISGGHMSHIENISDLTYILLRFVEK